jgi:hypothetical protein
MRLRRQEVVDLGQASETRGSQVPRLHIDRFKRPVLIDKCFRCGADIWVDAEDSEQAKKLSTSPVFLCRECNRPYCEQEGFASEISEIVILDI